MIVRPCHIAFPFTYSKFHLPSAVSMFSEGLL